MAPNLQGLETRRSRHSNVAAKQEAIQPHCTRVVSSRLSKKQSCSFSQEILSIALQGKPQDDLPYHRGGNHDPPKICRPQISPPGLSTYNQDTVHCRRSFWLVVYHSFETLSPCTPVKLQTPKQFRYYTFPPQPQLILTFNHFRMTMLEKRLFLYPLHHGIFTTGILTKGPAILRFSNL